MLSWNFIGLFPNTEKSITRIRNKRNFTGLLRLRDISTKDRSTYIFLTKGINRIDIKYSIPGKFEAFNIITRSFGCHTSMIMKATTLLNIPFDVFKCGSFFPKRVYVFARFGCLCRCSNMLVGHQLFSKLTFFSGGIKLKHVIFNIEEGDKYRFSRRFPFLG